MGRHKRIPTKNRKKLKSVDPFNKNAAVLRAHSFSKINWEPKDDKQEMTRSLIELQKRKAEADTTKIDVKRRQQRKNKVLAEAKKHGICKGRFETVQHFVRRVERMTYSAIKDHDILIKQGLVGRQETDIAADFKLLEDKEKRRKEQIKNEVRNKIKAAREMREYHTKLKEEKLKEKAEKKLERNEKMQRNEDVMGGKELAEIMDENTGSGKKKDQESSLSKSISDKVVVKKMRKKLGGSEKIRMKKRLDAKYARSEAILNQREVIAFGERYDAPPEYKGTMKDEMNPLMAKAGSKNLLLHSLLPRKGTSTTMYLKETGGSKQGEIARERVIEAYRELKRKKAI